MINFQTTLSGMLGSIVALRFRQVRWTSAYWARAFGLLPDSGKWTERIAFVYIYVLIVGIVTPAALGLLNNLYVLETKTAPDLQFRILYTTIPALIAALSLILTALPWKAWMLRLTFGDMTYLAPSPFDRRVLSLWRYLEMVVVIALLSAIPLIFLAPMFGSILARDVIPTIGRAMLAIGLWSAPLLALGWHLSMQEYVHHPPPMGMRWIARLGVIGAAGVLLFTKPDVLLWPGRLIVLLAMGLTGWGWLLYAAFALIGIAVIWLVARHLSMTRASAGPDVFARIQQLGFMILLDRQLLISIIGEARTRESYPVGTLPATRGVITIAARTALYYRRQYGQAIQLMLAGAALGLGLIIWRPSNLFIVLLTIVILVWQMPPWMARVFRSDLAVPFIMQFIPYPITRRLLAASVVPCALVLAGMIPVLIGFNGLLPDWAWGIAPAAWVLSLIGHVEVVGKRNAVSDRNMLSVVMGCLALFVVIWSAANSGFSGIFGLFAGVAVGAGVSFALLLIAEIRYTGFSV